jgi:hypothetical protein
MLLAQQLIFVRGCQQLIFLRACLEKSIKRQNPRQVACLAGETYVYNLMFATMLIVL